MSRTCETGDNLQVVGIGEQVEGLGKVELETAVLAAPKDPALWRRLGFACQGLGLARRARESFRSVVELNPEDAAGWYMLALAHEKLKERGPALAAWRKCLLHAKDPKMVEVARKHIGFLEGR